MLINGHEYSWSMLSVNILGTKIRGIRAIEYTEEQEIEDNYGAGNKPVSRGDGPVAFTGSITLMGNEVEALTEQAPNGRLQDIPEFDINVAFIPKAGGKIRRHKLIECRFKTNTRSMSQGDKVFEVQIPLAIGDINWRA